MKRSKRIFDVVGSTLGLLLLSPVMILAACLVKIQDRGPILFCQERVGLGGRNFRLRKFRTMRPREQPGSALTPTGDQRVTPVGRWLRRLKLDELPQLFNVLLGEMSLVGPRPEVPEYVARYTPAQIEVLRYVPGITDPASLSSWDEAERLRRSSDPERLYFQELLPTKIRRQLDYAEVATLRSDLLVCLGTVWRILLAAISALLRPLVAYRRLIIVLVYCVLVGLGYLAAYLLRFDFAPPPDQMALFWNTLPFLLCLRLTIYQIMGIFRGYWQHFSVGDLLALTVAATASSLAFVIVLVLIGKMPGVPRSVVLLDWAAAIFLSGGAHFVARSLREVDNFFMPRNGRRTLVIGAGDKAAHLLREVRENGLRDTRIVGLVVDNPAELDRSVHGVSILGTVAELEVLVSRHDVEFIIIALDNPHGPDMEEVVSRCVACRVPFKTLPSLQEVLEGNAELRIDQLRNVQLQDLLGRHPVTLNRTAVQAAFREKVVLITGAAGSIGSELARQVADFRPARLVLLDRAESPLYFTMLDLEEGHSGAEMVPVLCDITDEAHVGEVFAQHQPDYVIHAAAYKHVPMMEENVFQAVRNNVLGTLNVAQWAVHFGSKKVVLVSTDKAVRPSSVMGATKRIAERLILGLPALRHSQTDFRAVRFGNVLGSAGSVVPLFERQLAHGGPLTVTHPEVERYFMSITEAVELVLQAATLEEAAGKIVMLDMGRPLRIVDLAQKLIRLAGLEPYQDINIVFTGLRPGEKLKEELLADKEASIPTPCEKLRIVRCSQEQGEAVHEELTRLFAALAAGEVDHLLATICSLVPDCVAPLRDHGAPAGRPVAPPVLVEPEPQVVPLLVPLPVGAGLASAAQPRHPEADI